MADKHANVEFDELLSALACGEASRDQMKRLHLLLNEPQLRQRYVAWANQESTLYWEHGGALRRKSDPESEGTGGQKVINRLSHAIDGSDDTLPSPRSKSWLDRASRHPGVPSFGVAMLVFVALLLALASIPVSTWIADSGGKKDAERRQPQAQPEHVAKLTNWHNDKWLEGTRPPLGDPRLNVGKRLLLASGIAEITYNTGVKVVLQGPAEFVIGTEAEGTKAQREESGQRSAVSSQPFNSGYLALGKLVARVEGKKAEGFTIDTPSARVEDFGTEFGVEVDEGGAAEFVVLSGEVDVIREASGGRPAERMTLKKDEGAFVWRGARRITRRAKVDVQLIAAMRERLETVLQPEEDLGPHPQKLGNVTSGATWPMSPVLETWNPTLSVDTGYNVTTIRNPAQSFQFAGGDLKLDKLCLEVRAYPHIPGPTISATLRIFPIADVNQKGNSPTPSGADILNTVVSLPFAGDPDFVEIDLTGDDEVTLPATSGTAGYVFQILTDGPRGDQWNYRSTGDVYANGRAFRDNLDMSANDFSLAIVGTIVPEASTQQDETP